jgi:hypothetical protein
MGYKVIKAFRDKVSKKHYGVGSVYEADDKRIEFLQGEGFVGGEVGKKNEGFPKHTGGGYFELSNGEKVKGKDEAAAAEKELTKEGE